MNAIQINFADFVQIQETQPVTNSKFVAEAFGKRHDHVLAKIDELKAEIPASFHLPNFREMEIETEIGLGKTRKAKAYELTKDGFMLLVMGFTGKAAMQIKIAYIEAFNAMAEKLNQLAKPSASEYLNETECARIRAAVKARCTRTGETTQAVYLKLHAYMETDSYFHICREDFQTALNFLSSMENAPALFAEPQGIVIGEADLYQLAVLTHYTCKMGELLAHIAEPLRLLGSDYSGRAYSLSQEPHSWACNVCDFLARALPQMRDPKYSTRVQKILTGA